MISILNHSQYHSLDRYLEQNTALYDSGYYISANVIKHCIICDAILHDEYIESYSKNLAMKSNFRKGNTSDQRQHEKMFNLITKQENTN